MDKKNKVPGCDRLTRPEEIEELKKYLRKVKDVQEEYVENEFNNLEAPGITTGLFPKVNELPETIVELDTKKNIEVEKSTSFLLHKSYKYININI